jgi:hypothetical protein
MDGDRHRVKMAPDHLVLCYPPLRLFVITVVFFNPNDGWMEST